MAHHASPSGSRVHLIKRGSMAISYAEVVGQRVRHYAIGIPSVMLARRIQYTMDAEPGIRLYRSEAVDVSNEVDQGLLALGVESAHNTVVIDTGARLHIPKHAGQAGSALEDCVYHMQEVPLEEFLSFPFARNLGIVMPTAVIEESATEVVLQSQVVESSNSVASFRRALCW